MNSVLLLTRLQTMQSIVGARAAIEKRTGVNGAMAGGLTYRFWVVYVLAAIFTSMMPVAYAGTLSMVMAALFRRVRRKDAITTLTTVLTLALSIGSFFVINRTNSHEGVAQLLGNLGDSVGSVVMAFPAYGFAVYALVHPDPLGTWLFVLLSVASFAVFVVVARVVYMRIVTSLSSGAGNDKAYTGTEPQQQTPVFKALLQTEVRKIVRNSSILLYYVVCPLVICPVLFGVMLMTDSFAEITQKLASDTDATSLLGGLMLCMLMAFAVVSASSNKLAGTGVSREGSNWIHMKFIPAPLHDQILAKILPGFVVNALITLVFLGRGGAQHRGVRIAGAEDVNRVRALLLLCSRGRRARPRLRMIEPEPYASCPHMTMRSSGARYMPSPSATPNSS